MTRIPVQRWFSSALSSVVLLGSTGVAAVNCGFTTSLEGYSDGFGQLPSLDGAAADSQDVLLGEEATSKDSPPEQTSPPADVAGDDRPDTMAANDSGTKDVDASVAKPGGFPKTGIFQWGGAPPEWYAKFDVVMTRSADANLIASVRALNPKTLWLPARDFNRADEFLPGFPEEWYLHDSTGKRIPLYSSDTYWGDLSKQCAVVNGMTLAEHFVDVLAELAEGADGISSDGIYSSLHLEYNIPNVLSDFDLDHNGQNDLNEDGKGKDWVIDQWSEGVEAFLTSLRVRLGNKIIMINTGSTDTPAVSQVNGYVGEHIAGEYNWEWNKAHQAQTTAAVRPPPVSLANQTTDFSDPERIKPAKEDYPFMRFGLGRATLFGHYYEFEDHDAHYWNKYYDEFDLDLGEPTSGIIQVSSTGPIGTGVWVRFFDEGAVVLNADSTDATVTQADLSKLEGYAGPYFRFRGGQAPAFNNGQAFDSVVLQGHASNGALFGDAIVLVRSPTTAVSDILVDNSDSGTSPGSAAAILSSAWTQENCANAGGYYTLRCAEWYQSFGLASTAAGDGSQSAVFQAGIGLEGDYEIFEWHGYLGSSPDDKTEGKKVHHVIVHNGEETVVDVDQSTGYGKWNSMGVFHLAPPQASVKITNDADGPVLADAIKLVFIQ